MKLKSVIDQDIAIKKSYEAAVDYIKFFLFTDTNTAVEHMMVTDELVRRGMGETYLAISKIITSLQNQQVLNIVYNWDWIFDE